MESELRCSCNCGKALVVVAGPLLGRIRCHCTICQTANRRPFADSTILMAKHVPLDRVENVRFETLKEPPALQRGFCRSCGSFVMAHTTSFPIPFLKLAFVPVACYPVEVQLPGPEMHVYYEARIADSADELPKYDRWPSLFAMLRMLFRPRFRIIGHA